MRKILELNDCRQNLQEMADLIVHRGYNRYCEGEKEAFTRVEILLQETRQAIERLQSFQWVIDNDKRRHITYLFSQVDEKNISHSVAMLAIEIWGRLSLDYKGKLELPDAMPDGEGDIIYYWNRDGRHASLYIGECFGGFHYRDRNTDDTWDEEIYLLDFQLPEEVRSRLDHFRL